MGLELIGPEKIGTRFFAPFTSPLFDDIWATGKRKYGKDQKFMQKINDFSEADIDTFGPAYLCQRCGRIEDGTHRSWMRKLKGLPGMDVFVGRMYWKTIELLPALLQWLIEVRRLKTKDIPWMTGCGIKWGHLQDVKFTGRTYLDVGAQSGHSAIMGWNRGAAHVDGVELRGEICSVAKQAAEMFNAKEITLYNLDWAQNYLRFGEYDVVSCMGLMHYFEEDVQEAILLDFCAKARETLILELRLSAKGDRYRRVGSQTLITPGHLERTVTRKGFAVVKRENMKASNSKIWGDREIWIMERVHG